MEMEEVGSKHRNMNSWGMFKQCRLCSCCPQVGLLFISLITVSNQNCCHLFLLPLSPLCFLTSIFLFLQFPQQCLGLIAVGFGFWRHCQPIRGHLFYDPNAICLSHLCIWLFSSPVLLRGFLLHTFAASLICAFINKYLRSLWDRNAGVILEFGRKTKRGWRC